MAFGSSLHARPSHKPHGSSGPAFVPQLWRRVSLGRGALGRFFLETFVPRNLADGDELRRAVITAAVASLFVLIGPTYAALASLLEEPPFTYYVVALATFFTATLSLAILRRGRTRLAAWTLLGGASLGVLVPVLYEGAQSQAASNFVIVVVTAGLLVGWRGAVRLGVPFLLLLLVLGVAERQGQFLPEINHHGYGAFAVMQLLSVTVMLVIFDRVRLGLLRAQAELEAKLLQSQRLEAIGRLAGGVAHDFNNLLTIILANVTDLSDSSQPLSRDELEDVKHAALRASDLTRQLLAFSRRQRLAPRTFDLGGLLDEENAMLRRLLPETIALEVSHPAQPVWLHADAGQISQVLLNLAANARDAMPMGGTLRIELVRGPASTAGSHTTFSGSETKGGILLSIVDTGVGMDADTAERAFEPFFSTKASGAGTGLGLATVHGIILQSGGSVRVKSEPGRGTAVIITFPEASPPAQEPATSSRSSGPRPVEGRRILLVEDDQGVRVALARTLEAAGHHVVSCRGIDEAAHRWREEMQTQASARGGSPFDLIVSDVVMPGGSGLDLIRGVVAQTPSSKPRVLFVSGYPDGAVSDPLFADAAYLPKPFTRDELEEKVREVLAAPEPRFAAAES